jgi:hypothetical protein
MAGWCRLGPFAGAQAAHLGSVQHALDTSADPAGSLGLGSPDRLEDGKEIVDAYLIHGRGPDRGSVGGQGIAPLLPVLGVAPRRLMGLDVCGSNSAEGGRAGY